jgi:MoxR-like ATPase
MSYTAPSESAQLDNSQGGASNQGRRFQPGVLRPGPAPGVNYWFNERTIVAFDIAASVRRPLLVIGPSGSGKTSLGRAVAASFQASLYAPNLRSRSTVTDLCFTFDDRRALRDAQLGVSRVAPSHYIEPGILWWALDPDSAARRGDATDAAETARATDPGLNPGDRSRTAVVLLDDVDRTNDDFLLDLLTVLDTESFVVNETGFQVRATRDVLYIVTSNAARELTQSFVRRSVLLMLEEPPRDELLDIGRLHFPRVPLDILRDLTDRFVTMRAQLRSHTRGSAGIGIYLDAIRAVESMALNPADDSNWDQVARRILPMVAATPAPIPAPTTATIRPTAGVSVFINYAREDQDVAARLYDDLRTRGFSPWMDKRNLLPGQNWKLEIERAIRNSAFFIALLSSRSVNKRGYVQAELKAAYATLAEIPAGQIYVIPVRIDEVEVPPGPLVDLHWLDLEPYQSGLERIVATIEAVPPERSGAAS